MEQYDEDDLYSNLRASLRSNTEPLSQIEQHPSGLNENLSKLLGEEITVTGASRTDSGVHSMGNVAIFDTFFLSM